MGKGGSDPFVERVREATDIVEVIGAHVALKKAGARLGGLCPFHQEKTASFYVNPSLQAFHCFGCGAGGDVFSFIMTYEKMTFPEALRHLAERAGIPLPERRGPATDALERIREALHVARSWYRGQLEGPAGAEARAYLDHRGIRPETREAYGLGVSPDAWDGLMHHARALVSERSLVEAGLAVESAGGRIYDRFRNRLMIPIDTAGGAPVGFGGRALGDTEPKYLNSPETPVYRKGTMLFGVAPARPGIRDTGRVVVVEGYFDVIALVQAGIGGVVGTCGTALTPEQGTALRRLSDRVVLLFDGDPAGLRAALRALPILAGEIPDLAVARPPEGKDPDLWVRTEGPDAVQAAIQSAPAPLRFLSDLVAEGVMAVRDAAGRAVEMMAAIHDPLSRDLWVQDAASRFGIRPESFLEALARHWHRASSAVPAGAGSRARTTGDAGSGAWTTAGAGPEVRTPAGTGSGTAAGGSEGANAVAANTPWGRFEVECLRTALAHPMESGELAAAVEEARVLDPRLAGLLRWMAEQAEDPACRTEAALLSRASRESSPSRMLVALSLSGTGEPERPEPILAGIRLKGLRRRQELLNREIGRAQESGNQADLNRYLSQRQQLAQERARLAAALAAGSDRSGRGEKV